MSINILGTKIGMTQIFDDTGIAIPVTIVQVGPCIITQIKSTFQDGYNAIQIGYLQVNSAHISKPQLGHLIKVKAPALRYLREYKVESIENLSLGDLITVKKFKVGQLVNISGKKIGKGFTGYQKRHNFSRGPMTHGSKNHRQPGSIGPGTTPGRVFPGKKMAGRMGNNNITVKNLKIIDINNSMNLLIIKGSAPGVNGSLLNMTGR